jgi:hypothetical protein
MKNKLITIRIEENKLKLLKDRNINVSEELTKRIDELLESIDNSTEEKPFTEAEHYFNKHSRPELKK